MSVGVGVNVDVEVGVGVAVGVGVGVLIAKLAVIVPVPLIVAVDEVELALLKAIDPVLDDQEEKVEPALGAAVIEKEPAFSQTLEPVGIHRGGAHLLGYWRSKIWAL